MQLEQLNLILRLLALDYFRYYQLLSFLVIVVVLAVVVVVMMVLMSAHLSQYLQRIKWVIFSLPIVSTIYNYDLLPQQSIEGFNT